MSQVCKDVGWDGKGFYCLRCGKANFKSEASARGHLSQCKGRAIERGVPTVEMGGLHTPVEKTVVAPVSGRSSGGAYPLFSGGGGESITYVSPNRVGVAADPPGWYGGVDTRLRALENEYNHLLMEKNQPQYHPVKQDFFNQYKGVIIIGGIIALLIILSKQSAQCPGGSGGNGVNMGNVGMKALSKLVDTGITKGVSALFK